MVLVVIGVNNSVHKIHFFTCIFKVQFEIAAETKASLI